MEKSNKVSVIRYIYLYLVTAITIVLIIISTSGLIRLVLNEYVFGVKTWEQLQGPGAYGQCMDEYLFYTYTDKGTKVLKDVTKTKEQMVLEKADCLKTAEATAQMQHDNQVKTDLVWSLSMLIVALPLWFFHWAMIKRDHKKA